MKRLDVEPQRVRPGDSVVVDAELELTNTLDVPVDFVGVRWSPILQGEGIRVHDVERRMAVFIERHSFERDGLQMMDVNPGLAPALAAVAQDEGGVEVFTAADVRKLLAEFLDESEAIEEALDTMREWAR